VELVAMIGMAQRHIVVIYELVDTQIGACQPSMNCELSFWGVRKQALMVRVPFTMGAITHVSKVRPVGQHVVLHKDQAPMDVILMQYLVLAQDHIHQVIGRQAQCGLLILPRAPLIFEARLLHLVCCVLDLINKS